MSHRAPSLDGFHELDQVNLIDELTHNPQLLQAVLSRPIAFNPLFVDIAGSLTAGLLLSFAVDEPCSEDWGPLDTTRIAHTTRMTPAELKGARQRLKEAGLLLERRAGFPARTEYRLDFDRLKAAIVQLARKPAPAPSRQADEEASDGPSSQLH